jgi:hypothetical protein
MKKRRRDTADPEVGDPRRAQGVADQGGFEDELGSIQTGGGLGLGGAAAEGARSGAPSEASLMVNARNRPVEDEAGYDELADVRPGLASDRPIRVDVEDE